MSGKLRLSGSSSGYIELAAEATANNATITIPNAGFPGGVFASYAILEDQKANGGEGQDFSVNTWVTRDLNREYCDPDSIVSLADDQFTLGAGTYLIKWFTTFWRIDFAKSRLYDVTNSAVVKSSMNVFAQNAASNFSSCVSNGTARITITGTTVYKLEVFVSSADPNTGVGEGGGPIGPSDSDNTEEELYTTVEIWKEN